MILSAVQCAFFFMDDLESPSFLFATLQHDMYNTFNGEATLLPLPPEAPREMPIGNLKSSSGAVRVSLSRGRLDLYCNSDGASIKLDWTRTKALIDQLRAVISNQAGGHLARFGCTLSFFERSDNPICEIQKRYFSRSFSDSCNELSFRVNEPIYQGIRFNKLRTVSMGNITMGSITLPGIVETLDINTDQTLLQIEDKHIDDVLEMARIAVGNVENNESA